MIKNSAFLALMLLALFACKKPTGPEPAAPYYLHSWLGTYQDTSHTWTTYPQGNMMVTNERFRAVEIVVARGDLDSTLNFQFTYDDTIHTSLKNLKFDASFAHFEQWGGGSGYGYRSIQFSADSVMTFDAFQKCGIPCSSGEDFVAQKK